MTVIMKAIVIAKMEFIILNLVIIQMIIFREWTSGSIILRIMNTIMQSSILSHILLFVQNLTITVVVLPLSRVQKNMIHITK